MATIQILYFAALREHRGCTQEELEVEDGSSLAQIYGEIFGDSPLHAMPVAFARNQAYARGEEIVEHGDTVSFLPPLGGG